MRFDTIGGWSTSSTGVTGEEWGIRTGAGAAGAAGVGTDGTLTGTGAIVALGERAQEFRHPRRELSIQEEGWRHPGALPCTMDESWAGNARVPPAELHRELRHIAVAADRC